MRRRYDSRSPAACSRWLLVGLALSLIAPETLAQFNARGRGRKPAPAARPTSQPRKPRTQSPVSRPTTPPAPSAENSEQARRATLIERYRKLVIDKPGEEVPIKRLAELVRERDGNLNQLLKEFEEKAKKQSYSELLAWSGLLAEDGKAESAIVQLEVATRKAPGRAEGWLLKGRLEKDLERKSDARQSLEKALPLVHGPQRGLTIRAIRDLSLDLGDYPRASATHKKLLKGARGNLFLRGELGRELLRRGQVERAIEELSRVVQDAGGDSRALAPALRDLGSAQLEARKYADAIKSLTRASKLSVQNPGQRVAIDTLLADAHRQMGSLPEFLSTLKKTARTVPRLGLLGRLLEEEGDTEGAITAYKKALGRDSRNIDLQLKLVRLYELSGDLEGAVSQYAKLVRSSPRDVQLSLRYMEMLLAQGHRDRVVNEWDRIERATRIDPEAGLLLIDFAERLEEAERAERVLSRLSAEKKGDARFLVELGARYFRKGDTKSARQMWDRIVRVHRSASGAQVLLGEVLIDHDFMVDGLAALRKAVELAPDDNKARRALALGLERAASQGGGGSRNRLEREALAQWQELLKLPTGPRTRSTKRLARRHIVRLWRRARTLPSNLKLLEKKLNQTPPDIAAGRLLAEGYAAERQHDKTIVVLKKILKVQPGDRESLLALEQAHSQSGQFDEVLNVLTKLVESDPARAREYYERMARTATLQGKPEQALEYAERAVARSAGDPQAQAQIGDLYLLQGQTEKAKVSYRSALKQDDRLHVVALKLAELLAQSGDVNPALDLLIHVTRTSPDEQLLSRAARRALSLSIPAGRSRDIEDVLRPLAIGRPEQLLYRSLLLEALSTQISTLRQVAQYGTPSEQRSANEDLAAIADRSTQPLLAALAGKNLRDQQTAIDVLSYGASDSAGTALVAFAETAALERQRLQAVLAAGRLRRRNIAVRLTPLVIDRGVVRRGRVAQAAIWAIGRQEDHESLETLLVAIRDGDPDTAAYGALSAAHIASKASRKRHAELVETLSTVLNQAERGPLVRASAAICLGHLGHAGQLNKIETMAVGELLGHLVDDRSPLVVRSALQAIGQLRLNEAPQAALARGLLSSDPQLRQSATVAAVSLANPTMKASLRPLLPDSLTQNELSAHAQLHRLLSVDPTGATAETRHRALVWLADDLEEQARFYLRSSPQEAQATLAQLPALHEKARFGTLLRADEEPTQGADKRLEAFRANLASDLVELAQGPHPELADQALAFLSPGDESLKGLYQSALSDRRAHAALRTIGHNPSLQSLALLQPLINAPGEWSLKRRVVLTLEVMLGSSLEADLKETVLDKLKTLNADEHSLVAAEAARVLTGVAKSTE